MVQQPLYLLFIFSKWYNNFLQRKSYCSSSSLFFIPSFFPLSHFHSFSPALSSLLWKKPLGSCWLPLPIRCSTLHPISIFISLSKNSSPQTHFLAISQNPTDTHSQNPIGTHFWVEHRSRPGVERQNWVGFVWRLFLWFFVWKLWSWVVIVCGGGCCGGDCVGDGCCEEK